MMNSFIFMRTTFFIMFIESFYFRKTIGVFSLKIVVACFLDENLQNIDFLI
jgi:hypothetical protein